MRATPPGVEGTAGRVGRARRGAAALALALPLLLGACVADRTGAVTSSASPPGAPRVAGAERASSDADHRQLVAAFGGEVQAPKAHAFLTGVVDRLVRATDRPDEAYAVTILDSPVPNAFALPGGHVYVTRGLLALANDESEIAGVLAHEIAHVTLRHAAARTELALRSALVTKVVEDVLQDADQGAVLKTQSKVAFASFSRSQEFEADQVGVRTLTRAGFDPYGSVRFLQSLNRYSSLRSSVLDDKPAAPDMLATHPGTPERIALATEAARRAGVPGIGTGERAAYLAAIDGLPFGDKAADGLVRGARFIHPRLGVAFTAPAGFALENTPRAVVGSTADGRRRLLFDALEDKAGQGLDEVLRASWNEPLQPGSLESTTVNGYAAVTAVSRGKEWTFRLAAVRIGGQLFRLIVAGRPGSDPEPAFRSALGSIRPVSSEDERALRPLRLGVITAGSGDTVERLAARMALSDRAAERFRILNGLAAGAQELKSGAPYKVVE